MVYILSAKVFQRKDRSLDNTLKLEKTFPNCYLAMKPSSVTSKVQHFSNPRESLLSAAVAIAITVFVIGCVVILGWMFDIALLKSVLPGLVTMKANTAMGFILGGASLWFWLKHKRMEKRMPRQSDDLPPPFLLYCAIAAFIVFLIGFLTLIQYGFDVDLGIDQLLFEDSIDAVATASPGRMAVNSALNFLLLAVAQLLLCFKRPNYIAAQFFSVAAFLVAFLGFLGYIYGNSYFYRLDPSFTGMALHTAVAFLLWCAGIFFATCEFGAIATLTSPYAGGLLAQRLFPFALFFPPILCWSILIGYRVQIYTKEMGISLLGILSVVAFSIAIWWNARFLNKIDIKRRQIEEALEQTLAERQEELQERKSMASELATAVNEVTATMEELEASSQAMAEQAGVADTEARQIVSLSAKGTQTVKGTLQGITALQEKVRAIASQTERSQQLTSKIANITSVVSDLAGQTNMLALNAALEAVRAGDVGKGFGVVAGEIRKLADRSKSSAESINSLVVDIQGAMDATAIATDEGLTTVDSGVAIAQETADAFSGVVEAIDQIAVFNQQVALNARQQAAAVRQVVEAMNAIERQGNGK